ncbi:MAG: hypothetical protein E7462_01985 [Ruminococcaceae bacterium]|nr:hypothetical protein [Oscillospiraceae bacterium]
MKSYTLKKVNGAPNWAEIPTLQMDVVYNPADVSAWGQLCWDDTGIYVHLQAREANIRDEVRDLLGGICEDSCLEFFIRPTEAMSYFNIEFNPGCNVYLGFATSRHDIVRLIPKDHMELLQPHANRTEDGWEIFYHIPFTFIRRFFPDFTPREGWQFYGNCYKCGDATAHPHHFAWNEVQPGVLDFHCPAYFGRMILGGE